MSRLTRHLPDRLNEPQRRLYEQIASGDRARGPQAFPLIDSDGALSGPFNAMLCAVPVGAALQELGSALRYRSGLTDRIREMAILVVATRWDCAFERYAHEAVGRRIGLTDTELAALRDGAAPPLADPAEAVAVAVAHALAGAGDLDDSLYREASSWLGDSGVFELTALVGYYATLALQLRVFRVPAPDARADT